MQFPRGQCVLTGKMVLVQAAVTLSDLPKEVVFFAIIYILLWRQASVGRRFYRGVDHLLGVRLGAPGSKKKLALQAG